MTKFIDFPINFLLAGLFLFAIVSFAVGVAHEYGYGEEFMKSDKIDFSALQEKINETNSDAEAWGESFTSDNPLVSFGSLILFAIWGIATLIWGSVITLADIIFTSASNVLGIPPMVTGTVTAILILYMIFKIWRVIKAGE